MPRLPEIGTAKITNPFVKVLWHNKFGDAVFETAPGNEWGIKGDCETVLANSQNALAAIFKNIAWMYNPDQFTFPLPLRELALIRMSWIVESQFVYSQRCKIARAAGLDEEKIIAAKHWPAYDGWTREERAVLGFTDASVNNNGRMADELFDALKEFFTPEQIIDLVWATQLYTGLAKVNRILKVEFDDRDDPIVERAADPDFVPRMPVLDISHLEVSNP